MLCFASSSSVTGLGLPPLQPRSFLERQRRIQSNRLHPGPSFPRLADLAFPSDFLAPAAPHVVAAAAVFVFFGAARELVLLMGQTAGIANALARGRVRLVGFRLCTVGLDGGVELVANGEGGSGLQWLRSKEDMAFSFGFSKCSCTDDLYFSECNQKRFAGHAADLCKVNQRS